MIAPPPLDDFRPPYHLGAFGGVVVGLWSKSPRRAPSDAMPCDLGGFEPIRWRGRAVGAALVLRYDRPAAQYPVAYSEIILADVVRRGAQVAAMPFDLVLDNAFFVEAGRHHYHLPKRLDPTLAIDVARDAAGAPTRLSASGADLSFGAALTRGAPLVRCEAALVSSLLRGFTSHLSVIGSAERPLRAATIRVDPDPTTAYSARRVALAAGDQTLRPLGAWFWSSMAITVGVPHPVAR